MTITIPDWMFITIFSIWVLQIITNTYRSRLHAKAWEAESTKLLLEYRRHGKTEKLDEALVVFFHEVDKIKP
jgi:hypothetical protein